MEQKNIVDIKRVNKTYQKKGLAIQVLTDISFSIRGGEFIVIHGESGSGKSTLLNLIAGFDTADSGQVTLDGVDITQLNVSQKAKLRGKSIGFVFQNFQLLPELTAQENVMIPLLIGGMKTSKAKMKAQEMLEYVNLSNRMEHKPDELSGGQNQRVAVARALVTGAPIILADEPTGNLDSKNRWDLLGLLKKINIEKQTTIIMVTHSKDEIRNATRVIELKDGKIICAGEE